MKTLLILYMLLLAASTVISRTTDRSINTRINGNSSVSIRTVHDRNTRIHREIKHKESQNGKRKIQTVRNEQDQNTSIRSNDRHSVSNINNLEYSSRKFSAAKPDIESYYISHHPRIENFIFRGHSFNHHFEPLRVRRIRFPFLFPHIAGLIWSIELRNEFYRMYPDYYIRDYNPGFRIPTISAYDANAYVGEIVTVYGDLIETEYSKENDEYYLYVGQEFPNQDFSVVVPGLIARENSRLANSFIPGSHIVVTGLITTYNNKPEIVVKKSSQIDRY